ncbi:DUF1993 family protein [Alcaligenaceae bacterium]|nr:DUF1993 family protein [Alcaligenaceae bacterium]
MTSPMYIHSVPVFTQMLTALKTILAQADAQVQAKSMNPDALLTQTLAFIGGVDAAKFEDGESREIVLRPGTPKEKKLNGQAYLANYGLPQFFFHVTTAYALLRHNGLAIGKRDYMGAY